MDLAKSTVAASALGFCLSISRANVPYSCWNSFYAVLLSQWLGSFHWVLLFCWPITVNVAQYTAILHYSNLQTKEGISSFSYSCECYWVWFSCFLTTQGVRLSCLLTTQSRVYEIYTCVGAFNTPTQCSTITRYRLPVQVVTAMVLSSLLRSSNSS